MYLASFCSGIGFAFNAPVWASIIPEIVQEELASAITLGGVQMNLGGIVGPALGGLLFTDHGPGDGLFSKRLGLPEVAPYRVGQTRFHRREDGDQTFFNFVSTGQRSSQIFFSKLVIRQVFQGPSCRGRRLIRCRFDPGRGGPRKGFQLLEPDPTIGQITIHHPRLIEHPQGGAKSNPIESA